eukprot:scaffold81474_cov43-Phaeocystis_antarctica.AAC.1
MPTPSQRAGEYSRSCSFERRGSRRSCATTEPTATQSASAARIDIRPAFCSVRIQQVALARSRKPKMSQCRGCSTTRCSSTRRRTTARAVTAPAPATAPPRRRPRNRSWRTWDCRSLALASPRSILPSADRNRGAIK